MLFTLLPTFAVTAKTPDVLQVALLNRSNGVAQLARLKADGHVERSPLDNSLQTPLGSIWKLFVYAYAVDRQLPDPGYTCQGHDKEEVYCCSQKGERIDRDTALVRSCGLYFSPDRLGVDAKAWRAYWQQRIIPAGLLELPAVAPKTTVNVQALLQALKVLPAQQQARAVLLDVLLDPHRSDLITHLGGRLRVKTWSWYRNQDPNQRIGGFAGWLTDGTPLWAAGQGTSVDILAKYGQVLDSFLPITAVQLEADNCVDVNLFARYPITAVYDRHKQIAESGVLHGAYRLQFANGNTIGIESAGDIRLSRQQGKLLLRARMPREEYIARVLDREAAASPLQAARALAITARSYLLQNAAHDGECLLIDDSSASQRVAPRPASEASRAVAAWTADVVLAGEAVNYHLDTAGPNRLVWRDAVAQANNGMNFDAILQQAFPRNSLAGWQKPATACETLADAEDWLKKKLPRWRELLDREPGYDETSAFSVCRLQAGPSHVDKNSRRIFVRSVLSQQDRLDITHEYLHLAFEAYPSGQDENYIEHLARRLLLEL
ncbi:DUF2300 domain-containing protein [Candidatus Methylobacter oryzae]|uniref:DUF2300 domain-containing protein n=2 Tax=Candidatus Methylobacter oryzae TaxID=2497749 RepID=A0ABY3CEL0_9GAMM|nr:DUF2300 domain-containing protein [Candidatus Methylobacter oryzae]